MEIKKICIKFNTVGYKYFLKTLGFSKDKTSRNLFKLFKFALYSILIVFLINLFSIGQSSFGEWGDFFGGVLNPILTFITFIALLVTIILQQTELRESRKEFYDAKKALLEQAKTQKVQHFENTFFNILKKFNIKEDIGVENDKSDFNSRYNKYEKIRYEFYKYHDYYLKIYKKINSKDAFNGLFRDNRFELNEYFRNLLFIIDFIIKYNLEEDEKKLYLNILFNDLTYNEIFLLFYAVISEEEFNKYKVILENYGLLDRLSIQSLIYPNIDLLYYKNTAYGKNELLQKTYARYKNNLEKNDE